MFHARSLLWLGLLLVPAALMAREGGPEARKLVYDAAGPLWKKVQRPPLDWLLGASIPIPSAWPPDGSSTVYYYLVAYGMWPGKHVRNHVSTIWGRVTVDCTQKRPPKAELLSESIRDLGVQPLPLRPPEPAAWEQINDAQLDFLQFMRNGRKPEAAVNLREPLRTWLSLNPLFARQLRTFSPAFIEWLGYKESAPSGKEPTARQSPR